MLNIPKNTYAENTRCDENVVQVICDAFLDWQDYHPHSDGPYRPRDGYVAPRRKVTENGREFAYRARFVVKRGWEAEPPKGCLEFTNAEMDKAVEELIKAGYHMYRSNYSGTWSHYFFSHRPALPPDQYAVKVDTIPHFL